MYTIAVCLSCAHCLPSGLPDEEARGAGSTATVGMIRKDHIIVANVGDSRAVLCRKGKVWQGVACVCVICTAMGVLKTQSSTLLDVGVSGVCEHVYPVLYSDPNNQ